jgi:hypothetical protein
MMTSYVADAERAAVERKDSLPRRDDCMMQTAGRLAEASLRFRKLSTETGRL